MSLKEVMDHQNQLSGKLTQFKHTFKRIHIIFNNSLVYKQVLLLSKTSSVHSEQFENLKALSHLSYSIYPKALRNFQRGSG